MRASPQRVRRFKVLPIYEFRCRSCDFRFEALRPMGDTGENLDCPSCGALAPEKLLSVFAASTPQGGGHTKGSSAASCGSGFR